MLPVQKTVSYTHLVSWGFRDRNVLVSAGAETICDDMDALYRALREG